MNPEPRLPSDSSPDRVVAFSSASRPVIPDYELLRPIGQGSYGDVWLARGLTGVWRAIKIVWRDRFPNAEPFEREFKGLKKFSALKSPEAGQLALLHVGQNEAAGFFYYVMELADDVSSGSEVDPAKYSPLTLKEVRAMRGRLPAAECVGMGVEIARSLAGLHGRGLVHRDIKPSNIILVGGVPKLADIGLVAESSGALTYVGTEGFVPPEGPGKPAADVYALGRLLYELATGLDREEFPRLPPELNKLPDRKLLFELNEVILRCCDPAPGRRYPDGAAVLADLRRLQTGSPVRRRWRGRLAWAAAAVVLAGVVLVASRWKTTPGAAVAPTAGQSPARAPVSPRSLAVLPFEDLSGEPDKTRFADGMHEELLTELGRLPALQVIARTSVLRYADPARRDLRQIGETLGVGAILEGTIRREAGRVRINLHLVDAKTARETWSNAYERKLDHAFEIQADIARDVAAALQLQLVPEELAALQRRPTANPQAYELYVKARLQYLEFGIEAPVGEYDKVAALLNAAVQADPGFAEAYALLARVHAGAYFFAALDQTPARRELARQALAAALRLAPTAPETEFARGRFAYACDRDFRTALAHYETARAGLPNDVELLINLASAYRRVGRQAEAAETALRALALNPADLVAVEIALQVYFVTGRCAEAVALANRYPGDAPAYAGIREIAIRMEFEIDGNREKLLQALRAMPPTPNDPRALGRDFDLAWISGDLAGAAQIAANPDFPDGGGLDGIMPEPPALARASAAWFLGDLAGAARHAAEAVEFFKTRALSPRQRPLLDFELARCAAFSGRKAEALQLAARIRGEQLGRDAVNDGNLLRALWGLYLIIGARDEALECIRQLKELGYVISPRWVRLTPVWRLTAADPRFEALVPLPAAPAPKTPPTPAEPAVPAGEKSLVVLPFENFSPDPQNAYFTAGLHAEVIAALSRLPDLRVMSRATADTFKDGKTPLPEIGRKLGVADVLTGNVWRDGQSVRVQLELRRARDEALLWQQTFEHKLEPGFALQDEIVTGIARILQARSDVGEYSGARFMTRNPQAYELFLQAREILYRQGRTKAAFEEQARLCEKALKLDPDFMSGASLAASAYSYLAFDTGQEKGSEIANRAKYWAERASQLVPGGAGDGALSVYYNMVEHDYARALSYAKNEARALPNDANGYIRVGTTLMAFGRWTESAAALDRALALDPLNSRVLYNRVIPYAYLRRLPEFEAAVARSVEFGGKNIHPDILDYRIRLTGRLPDLDGVRRLKPADRVPILLLARDYAAVVADTAEIPKEKGVDARLWLLSYRAVALEALGRSKDCVAVGKEMVALAVPLAPDLDGANRMRLRAWALSFADQGNDAVQVARRQLESDQAPWRTWDRFADEITLARVYAWAGRPKECIDLLARLLREPSLLTVGFLRLSPVWDKVRDEPAFQALLADPKNSAPLGDDGPDASASRLSAAAPPASAPIPELETASGNARASSAAGSPLANVQLGSGQPNIADLTPRP